MIKSFRGEYGWLSNMSSCKIEYAGHTFNSVENAYMYAKNPYDKEWIKFCLENPPNIVKKESKKLKIREDWHQVKKEIMYKLLVKKFTQEPFKSKLLTTGDCNIMEGNFWNDTFWGFCLKTLEGENHLGRFIMYIRLELKKGRLGVKNNF